MVESSLSSFITFDPATSHFPLQNIPFGTMQHKDGSVTCCTRIGDQVVDLSKLEAAGLFNGEHFSKLTRKDIFAQRYLNDFMELGKDYWHEARVTLQSLFSSSNKALQDNADLLKSCLHAASTVTHTIPVKIGDYTDFYSSKNHAYNVGVMFRGPDNAL